MKKEIEKFNVGDVIYISNWRNLPDRPKDSCYYDKQSLETLKCKKFWKEISGLLDTSKKWGKWEFVLDDGSNLTIEAMQYGMTKSDKSVENPQSLSMNVIDVAKESSDKNDVKCIIRQENKFESLLPPYETFSINTKFSNAKRKNYPSSLKIKDGKLVTKKEISDYSVPFNYLLNSPFANAVRKVVVFNDANHNPYKTIVLFDNGDRIVVKRNKKDEPDLKQSILWAIVKHSFGTSIDRQLDKIISKVAVNSEELSRESKSSKTKNSEKQNKSASKQING